MLAKNCLEAATFIKSENRAGSDFAWNPSAIEQSTLKQKSNETITNHNFRRQSSLARL